MQVNNSTIDKSRKIDFARYLLCILKISRTTEIIHKIMSANYYKHMLSVNPSSLLLCVAVYYNFICPD